MLIPAVLLNAPVGRAFPRTTSPALFRIIKILLVLLTPCDQYIVLEHMQGS